MRKRSPDINEGAAERPRGFPLLPGAVLAAILGAGIVLTALDPATFSLHRGAEVLRGAWAAGYAAAYEEGLALRQAAVTARAAFRYALFAEGEPGVLVGTDGWLYSTEEFVAEDPAGGSMSAALDFVRAVRDELTDRGIELVVALVPTKAEIYPEHRGRYPLPSPLRVRYETARQGIAALGVVAPDLANPLRAAKARQDVFLRTDTHWTEYGAAIAADVLAAQVRPVLDAAGSQREEYVTERGGRREWRGDLMRFIPLGPLAGALGPRPDTVVEVATSGPESDMGLFDAIEIPVALVGTSYSASGIWNFDGALKAALSADVLNVAAEGRGPFAPMRSYLASPAIDDPRPDLVLWEIPVRYLGVDVPLGIGSVRGRAP